LHKPVGFIILPIFALANTGVFVGANWMLDLTSTNSLGLTAGLIVGKPLGVMFLCFVAVTSGICRLPLDLNWQHIFGAGMLGGIGFTISMFITNLAFAGNTETISASKLAILLASLAAGTIGFLWFKLLSKRKATDNNIDTMDLSN
jgi:NhaA family Na+:H+ antiporter